MKPLSTLIAFLLGIGTLCASDKMLEDAVTKILRIHQKHLHAKGISAVVMESRRVRVVTQYGYDVADIAISIRNV
jgi:hypothetical protein